MLSDTTYFLTDYFLTFADIGLFFLEAALLAPAFNYFKSFCYN